MAVHPGAVKAADLSSVDEEGGVTSGGDWGDSLRRLMIGKQAADRRVLLNAEERRRHEGGDRDACRSDASRIVVGVDGACAGALAVAGRSAKVSSELFRDLEVLVSQSPSCSLPVVNRIDYTQLSGGRCYLTALLQHPTDDAGVLTARQRVLRALDEKAALVDAARKLREMASSEPDVLWMFAHRDDGALRTLYDIAFFRNWFLRGLNGSSVALSSMNVYRIVASPLVGLLSPVVYFLVPFLVIRFKMGLSVPFTTYMRLLFASMTGGGALGSAGVPTSARWLKHVSCAFSMVFYFQSVFTSVELSGTLRTICKGVTARVDSARMFFDNARELEDALWSQEVTDLFFPGLVDHTHVAGVAPMPLSPPGQRRRRALMKFRLMTNFGRELRDFKSFDYDAAAAVLRRVYALDALLSIPESMRRRGGCSWARFDQGEACTGPRFELRGVWHPSLDPNHAVSNDWGLGSGSGSAGAPHALLTGPNAGGKSTLLKAALLSALMAQTLTMTPCKGGCDMTPFSLISSHINAVDCQGRESLFEAEMHRAKRNLDALNALAPGQRAFVVMDEIFSSTNPVEGIAGAFAVARRMTSHPGALCVISTHFHYLCRLQRETNGLVRNFRMPLVTDRPYVLQRGVSRQFVALEMLRANGFDDALIDDAIAVKRRLLAPPTGRIEPSTAEKDPTQNVIARDDGVAPVVAPPCDADPTCSATQNHMPTPNTPPPK